MSSWQEGSIEVAFGEVGKTFEENENLGQRGSATLQRRSGLRYGTVRFRIQTRDLERFTTRSPLIAIDRMSKSMAGL